MFHFWFLTVVPHNFTSLYYDQHWTTGLLFLYIFTNVCHSSPFWWQPFYKVCDDASWWFWYTFSCWLVIVLWTYLLVIWMTHLENVYIRSLPISYALSFSLPPPPLFFIFAVLGIASPRYSLEIFYPLFKLDFVFKIFIIMH